MKKIYLCFVLALASLSTLAQWSTDPSENNPLTPKEAYVEGYYLAANDEGVTYVLYTTHTSQGMIYHLQILDAEGYALYPEDHIFSDYSNSSSILINDLLSVDKEGNAIVAITDTRYAEEKRSYTAYKITPTGEMLWGETGIRLEVV